MKTPLALLCCFAAPALLGSAAPAQSHPHGSVAPRQVADLKSFFHGEAPPPPKAPAPPFLATVATAPGVVADPQVEAFFRAFAAAVKARDGSRMAPYLSEKYTIADLPEDHVAADFFAQAVERTPGPEAITLQSIQTDGGVRTVQVELKYPTKTKVKTFQFDAAGKLLASDLFTLQRVEHSL